MVYGRYAFNGVKLNQLILWAAAAVGATTMGISMAKKPSMSWNMGPHLVDSPLGKCKKCNSKSWNRACPECPHVWIFRSTSTDSQQGQFRGQILLVHDTFVVRHGKGNGEEASAK